MNTRTSASRPAMIGTPLPTGEPLCMMVRLTP
jgi:hypothetical protein